MPSIQPKKLTDKDKAEIARAKGNVGEAESEWRTKMQGKMVTKSKDKKIVKANADADKLHGTSFMADSKIMANRYKRADKKGHEGR